MPRRRSPLTGRAAVLGVVLVVLVLSFAYPLRAWFDQRAQISELSERTISQRELIAQLRTDLERWDDPAYVEAVARDRLRFVMPGEASFVVLGTGTAPAVTAHVAEERGGDWWQRLWSTVEEADQAPADLTVGARGGEPADGGATADPSAPPTTPAVPFGTGG